MIPTTRSDFSDDRCWGRKVSQQSLGREAESGSGIVRTVKTSLSWALETPDAENPTGHRFEWGRTGGHLCLKKESYAIQNRQDLVSPAG